MKRRCFISAKSGYRQGRCGRYRRRSHRRHPHDGDGRANALAVMAVGDKGCFLNAPDMYMEKLIVGPGAKGAIDLNLPLEENLHNIARALNKPLGELTVTVLAKPRHDAVIAQLQQLGVRVFAIPDGDVAASILTCMPDSEVDVLYGIGGAPEGWFPPR